MSRKKPPVAFLDVVARPFGNGAHVTLPKAWRGKRCRVEVQE